MRFRPMLQANYARVNRRNSGRLVCSWSRLARLSYRALAVSRVTPAAPHAESSRGHLSGGRLPREGLAARRRRVWPDKSVANRSGAKLAIIYIPMLEAWGAAARLPERTGRDLVGAQRRVVHRYPAAAPRGIAHWCARLLREGRSLHAGGLRHHCADDCGGVEPVETRPVAREGSQARSSFALRATEDNLRVACQPKLALRLSFVGVDFGARRRLKRLSVVQIASDKCRLLLRTPWLELSFSLEGRLF